MTGAIPSVLEGISIGNYFLHLTRLPCVESIHCVNDVVVFLNKYQSAAFVENISLKRCHCFRCAYGWNYTGTVVENLGSGTTDWGDASSTGRANGAGRMRTSIYVIYIKKWLEVFPKQNFLFLKTEDYSRNTKGTLYNEVFSFLDLDNISHEALKKLEQSISKERKNTNIHSNVEMFSETRQLLEKFYEPYNTELSALLKDVKYTWNDR